MGILENFVGRMTDVTVYWKTIWVIWRKVVMVKLQIS